MQRSVRVIPTVLSSSQNFIFIFLIFLFIFILFYVFLSATGVLRASDKEWSDRRALVHHAQGDLLCGHTRRAYSRVSKRNRRHAVTRSKLQIATSSFFTCGSYVVISSPICIHHFSSPSFPLLTLLPFHLSQSHIHTLIHTHTPTHTHAHTHTPTHTHILTHPFRWIAIIGGSRPMCATTGSD